MKKISKLLGLAVVLSSTMVSCSSSEDDVDLGEAKTVVNMLSESVPVKLTAEQTLFVNDNNKFTMNFLKTVNEADRSGKSFIYSPLSITYALGMVNDAATGLTEKELEETLGFHQGGIQAVNDYCKKLIDGLPKVDDKVTLNIANAIFLNKDFTLKPQFEQDMQTYYDAKAEALDFSASNTLDHINGWCKEKTNGMIPSILDDIDPLMVSYLLNAIYFKADWASKFDPKNTKNETFTTENDNSSTDIPMMHQNVLISYLKTDTYSAIILPYGTGLWNMTVLLPEKGKTTDDVIKEVAQSSILNNHVWCKTGGNYFEGYEVDLKLPRFETSSDTDKLEDGLIGLMKKMGINRAFEDGLAEIPNMCEVPVYVELMRQKAKIKVSEEGSEAAAVTVAGVANYSMGSEPIEYPKATFHANRPFVYVIREQSSGVILFVGKFTGE